MTLAGGLWGLAFVAETDEEAQSQAERQFGLVAGKDITVDRLSWSQQDNDGHWEWIEETFFVEPYPLVRPVGLRTDSGWDCDSDGGDGVLYPEWELEAVDPDQQVTTQDGETYRLGDLADDLMTTAPGVGTAGGFGSKDGLVWPEKSGAI